MADVMPKVALYTFLSIICLLINLSIFFTGALSDASVSFSDVDNDAIYSNQSLITQNDSLDISAFTTTAGVSFIPFVNLLPIAFSDMPSQVTVVTGIIIGIISAYQLFLLAIIVINMMPKVLGSGWDV